MEPIDGGVTAATGFHAGGTASGIKKNGAPDLAMIFSERPAVAAGVFTTNIVQAAPVLLSKSYLTQEPFMRAVIINSGNANACTGIAGYNAAVAMTEAAGRMIGTRAEEVLVASTGVIGAPLPVEKIAETLAKKPDFLSEKSGKEAARAIMTTDTFPKEAAVRLVMDGVIVHVGGMAKGSGMIHPQMATMLGFITTDLAIDRPLLQQALQRAAQLTFNRITVDGDTSTNDCLLALANGAAGNRPVTTSGAAYEVFLEALVHVCRELARMIVRDGEGATKFVTINVRGARTEQEAEKIAKSIAGSNLVKTAIFGEDANWGRILAAVGYAGVPFDPGRVEISLGALPVCRGGMGLCFDEKEAKAILQAKEITIEVRLGEGVETATVWTCDLSYDYVKINGSYRT